ncbi:exosome complex exonuclease RRP40 [Spathaspora passalidarum NRRL Y-27907]|uniref:Exosome complex exonuclease RRP40 n=1 Tax=Spathaspora passalidarum (strain NRRL Y-27907 / 11-Y1) TaxID=619300 RepID=G3ADY9_SPAPN|nr:exosome complex exonuclease RRP40 [Spathaspora passalidarum NRRL Y-27907]EGW34713.1 exosome complex exonuclease RRP40 [Spathaspora passalidarum NRRL Y-27907]
MADLIVPGDKLPIEDPSTVKTTIGPGVYKMPTTHNLIPCSSGVITVETKNSNQLVYIESNNKRYIPHTNDFVIGVVTGVVGESYKVQLQDFSSPVLLGFMAFPNATKKNRPNLKIGSAVYARVLQDIPEIEAELECIDPTTGKEGGFGLLDESGYIFDVELNFARELLFNPKTVFLQLLSTKCQFEIAIGINGKIWIKCGEGLKEKTSDSMETDEEDPATNIKDLRTTLAAANFLIKCQHITQDKLKAELTNAFKGI